MTNISQRHHYIPQFMIKGFIGEDQKLAIFNKVKGKLDVLRKSPSQIFFEWNRNTFEINGEVSDFVEELHRFGESQFAPVYKKISQQNGSQPLNAKDLFALISFIGVTHWRVPKKDKEVALYLSQATNEDLFFNIRKKGTNEEAPEEMYSRIMNEPAFKESAKIIIAIRDYLSTFWLRKIDDWNIYYSSGNVELHFHLLGDDPVILREENESNIFKTELIFPLSKGKTVYHTNGKKLKELSPEHRVLVDVLIFLQADKIVCGPNSEYLNQIAQFAELYKNENDHKELKEKVFRIFE